MIHSHVSWPYGKETLRVAEFEPGTAASSVVSPSGFTELPVPHPPHNYIFIYSWSDAQVIKIHVDSLKHHFLTFHATAY
jgi:hypothetical protein